MMDNLLDKHNNHLFLEKPADNNKSFIKAVMMLVDKFESLVTIDSKFTEEDIKLLTRLVKEEVDINIETISEDLKKGNYLGYRKLDIDLLKNFKDYSERLTDEEKVALWSNPEKQVYYDTITVYFTDDTHITKTFSQLVNNHHKLYSEIDSWDELKQKYGSTQYDIFADTPIPNHELFRFWDATRLGSTINHIVLHVAPNGQNQNYDAVFAGVKTYTPSFAWLDTTSTLEVIAHRINEIIHTSDYIEEVGATFVEDMTSIKNETEGFKNQAQESASNSENSAVRAEEALSKQQNLTVNSTTLNVDQEPSVSYNGLNNTMTFGLPRSEIAVVGLSNFAINTANGHLSFNITNESDVKRVYVDDSTGNVIIEMNGE